MRHFLVPVLIAFAVSGCIKKTGCTDYSAMNYNEEAEQSDRSCIYQADMAIYWTVNEYQNFMQDSASTYLNFYLDDKLIGGSPADNYYTTNVSCSNGAAAITTKDTLYYDSQVFKQLKVIDQAGKVMYNYSLQIYAGCNEIQL